MDRVVQVNPTASLPAPASPAARASAPASLATPILPHTPTLDAIRSNQATPSRIHAAILDQPAIFNIKNFSLWYGPSRAIHHVSMPIPTGRVAALIGPSGCGKSTLLRALNRMNDLIDGVRVEGSIDLEGANVYGRGIDVIGLRRRVGMVFQKPNPFPMSIFENIAYPLRIAGERNRATLAEVCERTLRQAALWDEVKDRLKHSALSLSGGQQQRLCIARAIAAEPQVLLMDEPCSALDPIATLKVEEFIRELSGRLTVVIVTHNMQQAARVSDATAFMYMGRLVEYGRTLDIFSNPLVAETEHYVTGRFG